MKNRPFFLALMILVLVSSIAARPMAVQAATELTCTRYHTVARGEYLSQIARKYGVTWRWLVEINKISNPNRIYPNQSLCVEAKETPVEAVCTQYHTVQRGEFLSQIARKYGVTWRWLAEINKLANPSRIYPNQSLCVEVQEKPVEAVCTQYHTVARGEYLSQIARKYGVTWRWLAEINKLANPGRIYSGQQICVATSTG